MLKTSNKKLMVIIEKVSSEKSKNVGSVETRKKKRKKSDEKVQKKKGYSFAN